MRLPMGTPRRFSDVVVVGGGLVGNAMAAAIASSSVLGGNRVVVIEGGKGSSLPATSQANYSNRVSAVAPPAIKMFQDFGIWENLKKYRVKKVDRLHVIDSCSTANIHFEQLSKEHEIAYIIENDAIVGALCDRLKDFSSVQMQTGARVKNIDLGQSRNDLATVHLENGDVLDTSLVIGADGFRSRVRSAMNAESTGWEYDQMGVVATLMVQTPKNNIAWQRFSPLGPIALLPLSDNLSSLVWTTSKQDAKRLLSLTSEQFVDELNHLLFTEEDQNSYVNQALFVGSRFSPCESLAEQSASLLPPTVLCLQSDTRAAFPLGFSHTHSYVADRTALVGDAAHRVHPLAGQGVNLGWSDVRALTIALEAAHLTGNDLGCGSHLADYDSKAQAHNVPVMVAIDWLNRLYATRAPAVVAARSFGLAAFNLMSPVKNLLIRQLSNST